MLKIIRPVYTYPCDSTALKMWRVKNTKILKTCDITLIDKKK